MSDPTTRPLPEGKAPPDLLFAALSARAPITDPDLLQGPGPGRDAAVIRVDGRAIVVAADPITFDGADTANAAVIVNANDIAALGAQPRWFLATVLTPPDTDASELSNLLRALTDHCADAAISLIGGHTEITSAVSRPIISGCMIGDAPAERIIPSDGARAGDIIIQAGPAAVEGTALLAAKLPDHLRQAGWSDTDLADAQASNDIDIRPAATALAQIGAPGGVHAMHDVTEGGIATAAAELTHAAGLGLQIDADAVLWRPDTLRLCQDLRIDPLGLLGSGTLLAAIAPTGADGALAALTAAGIDAAPIGRVQEQPGAILNLRDATRPLPQFHADEALRALADADRHGDPKHSP